jgi:hypothetical protein
MFRALATLLVALAPRVSAQAVALACENYADTATSVDIDIQESGILHPSTLAVDTGSWVYFADDDVNKIVRFTGDSTTPTFEVLAESATFGSISGICLSPFDQSLFVVDKLNSSLFVVPCVTVFTPENANQGPYCQKYGTYTGQYQVTLQQPSRCSVDKAGNVYVTQGSEVVQINSTEYSNKKYSISGALALAPITMDLETMDLYIGDSAAANIYRIPCTKMSYDGKSCLSLDFDNPVKPSTSGQTFKSASGLQLNRGQDTGEFDLIVSDSSTANILSISHPKTSSGTASLLVKLSATDSPADIFLDPLRYDIIIAEPMYSLSVMNPGALARLVCNDVEYAPSPSVGPVGTTTTKPNPSSSGMSGGSVFILIVAIVVIVYFGGGALFMRLTRQQCTIPNMQMWRNFAALVADGWFFAISCGQRRGGGGPPTPYEAGHTDSKATTTGATSDGPSYDNYDAMSDDL